MQCGAVNSSDVAGEQRERTVAAHLLPLGLARRRRRFRGMLRCWVRWARGLLGLYWREDIFVVKPRGGGRDLVHRIHVVLKTEEKTGMCFIPQCACDGNTRYCHIHICYYTIALVKVSILHY
jgi:hypothetical protein